VNSLESVLSFGAGVNVKLCVAVTGLATTKPAVALGGSPQENFGKAASAGAAA